jgi:hypothetical protein
MKILPILTTAAFLAAGSSLLQAQVWVNSYERQNGTHVDGYYRSSPNNTTLDNYSTRGNTNFYTGQAGTRSSDDGLQHYISRNNRHSYGNRW